MIKNMEMLEMLEIKLKDLKNVKLKDNNIVYKDLEVAIDDIYSIHPVDNKLKIVDGNFNSYTIDLDKDTVGINNVSKKENGEAREDGEIPF